MRPMGGPDMPCAHPAMFPLEPVPTLFGTGPGPPFAIPAAPVRLPGPPARDAVPVGRVCAPAHGAVRRSRRHAPHGRAQVLWQRVDACRYCSFTT